MNTFFNYYIGHKNNNKITMSAKKCPPTELELITEELLPFVVPLIVKGYIKYLDCGNDAVSLMLRPSVRREVMTLLDDPYCWLEDYRDPDGHIFNSGEITDNYPPQVSKAIDKFIHGDSFDDVLSIASEFMSYGEAKKHIKEYWASNVIIKFMRR